MTTSVDSLIKMCVYTPVDKLKSWRMNFTHKLLFFLATLFSCRAEIDCFLDGEECEIRSDNLVHTFMGVPTVEECASLCTDQFGQAFTYFGPDSSPYHNTCLIFSSCTERRPCQDCTTGSSQEECTCSLKYSGEVDDSNFVDLIGSVSDEYACKELCSDNSQCTVYTFYDSQDPVQPNVCVLLNDSGLRGPVVPCDHCVSGAGLCHVNQPCQVAVLTNGPMTQAIFAEEDMEVRLEAKEKDCYADLNVVAIGSGGLGHSAGGGSGYVETGTVRVSKNNPVLEVTVGNSTLLSGNPSKVRVGEEVVLKAKPGKTTDTVVGGDGYSGGGGYGTGSGGSNGGDGEVGDDEDSEAGRGSGLDLSSISLKSFTLTPGKGGVGVSFYGGGGGGVVVNGRKPESEQCGGQGFGGGGGYNGFVNAVSPGCVLIEL